MKLWFYFYNDIYIYIHISYSCSSHNIIEWILSGAVVLDSATEAKNNRPHGLLSNIVDHANNEMAMEKKTANLPKTFLPFEDSLFCNDIRHHVSFKTPREEMMSQVTDVIQWIVISHDYIFFVLQNTIVTQYW